MLILKRNLVSAMLILTATKLANCSTLFPSAFQLLRAWALFRKLLRHTSQ